MQHIIIKIQYKITHKNTPIYTQLHTHPNYLAENNLATIARRQPSSIVCDHRNAQQRSSNNSHNADSEYEAPNLTGQAEQPQYDVIQLGHTQRGPDAGQYDSLNPQTQGEQPQYDVISRAQKDNDAADYVNVM